MNSLIRTGLIAAAVCAIAGHSSQSKAADWAVEQLQTDSSFQLLYYAPVWQSFSVAPSTINRVEVSLVNLNFQLSDEKTLTLRLYDGLGLAGPLRYAGTVDAEDAVTDSGVGWVGFDLNVPANAPSGIYTFELVVQTERYGVEVFSGNAYVDGRAHFVGLVSGATFGEVQDLRFRIMTSIPEPAPALMLLCGGVWLAHRIRATRC